MNPEDLRRRIDVPKALTLGVVITGFIHLYVGINSGFRLLSLAGAGFLAGAVIFRYSGKISEELAFSMSSVRIRTSLSVLCLPYTGSQFYLYYKFYGLSLGPLAAVDKLVQLSVLVLSTIYIVREQEVV